MLADKRKLGAIIGASILAFVCITGTVVFAVRRSGGGEDDQPSKYSSNSDQRSSLNTKLFTRAWDDVQPPSVHDSAQHLSHDDAQHLSHDDAQHLSHHEDHSVGGGGADDQQATDGASLVSQTAATMLNTRPVSFFARHKKAIIVVVVVSVVLLLAGAGVGTYFYVKKVQEDEELVRQAEELAELQRKAEEELVEQQRLEDERRRQEEWNQWWSPFPAPETDDPEFHLTVLRLVIYGVIPLICVLVVGLWFWKYSRQGHR